MNGIVKRTDIHIQANQFQSRQILVWMEVLKLLMKKNRDECEMNGVDKRNEIMKD